jgi:putative tricarboxylic transport membrane protein
VRIFLRLALRIAAAALATITPAHAQPSWTPERTVEFVVGSTPGGGNDRAARSIQKIWNENRLLSNITVVNKVGGGGALAYTYVNQHPGDAHYIAVVRPGFLTNHILGRSAINYSDMTALGVMSVEPTAFAVRADSPIRTVADLVDRWKADPQSVSISVGSTRGSTTHFVAALVAKAAGVDARRLKVVTFGGGADSVTQVLGGHIDMMSASIDNAVPHHRSRAMRIIGIATARRSAALPDVPTFREQGFDVVMGGWTAIMGARGLTPLQIAYWESLLERAANHPEWHRLLAADSLEWEYLKAQATRDYLKQQYDASKSLLIDIGMLK